MDEIEDEIKGNYYETVPVAMAATPMDGVVVATDESMALVVDERQEAAQCLTHIAAIVTTAAI